MFLICSLVVIVELLSVAAYVHEEDAAVEVWVVFFRYHCLLYGVHATNRRAVGVSYASVAGTNTLNEGYFPGDLPIRGAYNHSTIGSRGAQNALKLDARNHVWEPAVAIFHF